jgi:hypothetical protein
MVGTLCRNVGAHGVGDGPETGRLGVTDQGEEPCKLNNGTGTDVVRVGELAPHHARP